METKQPRRTPCGYPAGLIKASDNTVYLVQPTGQMRRVEPKMTKAELKRHKKQRQRQRRRECRTVS
jgi:hypothetical protein